LNESEFLKTVCQDFLRITVVLGLKEKTSKFGKLSGTLHQEYFAGFLMIVL